MVQAQVRKQLDTQKCLVVLKTKTQKRVRYAWRIEFQNDIGDCCGGYSNGVWYDDATSAYAEGLVNYKANETSSISTRD